MKLLVTLSSAAELGVLGGLEIDIIDLKDPAEGSLGAPRPREVGRVSDALGAGGPPLSVALGDLPDRPGTAALAAAGAAHFGADFVKAGVREAQRPAAARRLLAAVRAAAQEVDPAVRVVAGIYGDWRRAGTLPLPDGATAAVEAGCDVLLIDTAVKDGRSLLELVESEELAAAAGIAHRGGLAVACAGGLGADDLPALRKIGCDVLGVRGAVCEGGRRGRRLSRPRVEDLIRRLRGDGIPDHLPDFPELPAI